jgi:hypothetical protein
MLLPENECASDEMTSHRDLFHAAA